MVFLNESETGELLRNKFISIKFDKSGTYSYILTNLEELIIYFFFALSRKSRFRKLPLGLFFSNLLRMIVVRFKIGKYGVLFRLPKICL